ncbi:MAG: hypothetical protein ACR2LH_09630 [Thermoleophilaceae bacterium]
MDLDRGSDGSAARGALRRRWSAPDGRPRHLGEQPQRPSFTERISERLAQLGFELATPVGLKRDTGYRFTRGDQVVDVLGPDGVGARQPRTIGNLVTIQVEGGTQALARTEVVRVRLEGEETEIRCPSLLGAILLKARSVTKKDRERDREDLLRLLTCVQDPQAMRDQLKDTECRWLSRADATLAFDPDLPTSSPRNRSASRAPRVACSLARAAGSRRPSLDRGPASSPATAGVSRR